MKLPISIAIAFASLLIFSACSDSSAAPEPLKKDDPRFIQLSSLVDQVRADDDLVPGRIFTEVVDGQQGMEPGDLNAVVIPKDGIYTIMLAPQSGKLAGCGRYWIAVNGEAVPNSSVQICQSCPTLTGVAVSQTTMALLEEDVVSFWQSGRLGIQATFPDEIDEPVVPSVIITVFKL